MWLLMPRSNCTCCHAQRLGSRTCSGCRWGDKGATKDCVSCCRVADCSSCAAKAATGDVAYGAQRACIRRLEPGGKDDQHHDSRSTAAVHLVYLVEEDTFVEGVNPKLAVLQLLSAISCCTNCCSFASVQRDISCLWGGGESSNGKQLAPETAF